jgi:hypothetical protein
MTERLPYVLTESTPDIGPSKWRGCYTKFIGTREDFEDEIPDMAKKCVQTLILHLQKVRSEDFKYLRSTELVIKYANPIMSNMNTVGLKWEEIYEKDIEEANEDT